MIFSLLFFTVNKAPRQGCAAETDGFCLGLHPVMTSLQAKHTDFEFRAVTDDIVPLAPPPASNSFEDW